MSATHVTASFTVSEAQDGQRVDALLTELLADYSRSQVQHWIRAGQVLLQGKPCKPKDTARADHVIVVDAELPEQVELKPEAIDLDVVHEDDALLVINKPAGLVVHPGAGNSSGTLVNALLHHHEPLSLVPRAGLIHRLDKETSGLLVVAKTLPAHAYLTDLLAARNVRREYEAIARGVMIAGGTVDASIARHRVDRLRMAVDDEGKSAVTHYRVAMKYRAHTHLRIKLETGRTHQIRVHMAHIQHPLVGDGLYGGRLAMPGDITTELRTCLSKFRRQALHARRLAFEHPDGGVLDLQHPAPNDFQALAQALRNDAEST